MKARTSLSNKAKGIILCVAVVLVSFVAAPHGNADVSVCEWALVRCFGKTNIMEWLSRAILGQILYCLNGYDFCKTFVEPFIN
ncbi:MAG: hypothetical protein SCM96_05275 [Acidobacteriota bacterium]|nr:hypothetical protein [Acidobacteriota bacterium]